MTSLIPGQRLDIPVPDEIFNAVGYNGDARYIALHWTRATNEAEVTDGQSAHRAPWAVYLTYVRHPRVVRGLALANLTPWDFGSGDSNASRWLVLDRREHTAYAVPVFLAIDFLYKQSQRLSTPQTSPAPPDASVHTLEELRKAVAEDAARVRRLRQALDDGRQPGAAAAKEAEAKP